MTTVTLNLLAEEQIALHRRARDPFKFALAIGVALVALAVGAGVVTSMLIAKRESAVASLTAKLKSLGEGTIAEQEVLYQWKKSLAEDIVALNKTRVLYAAQLAVVKDVVPANIQLSGLRLAFSTDSAPPLPSTTELGDEASRPSKAARPKKVERLSLRLDGQAFGSPPELVVDEFMTRLREDPVLKQQLEEVQLRSIARDDGGPDNKKAPKATFVLDCPFKEQP